MKLHDLRPDEGATKKRKRVGRGISAGQGKTAGRGTKGQGARSGGGKGPYFEGGQLPLVRRLPFKRGFTRPGRMAYQEVNVDTLDRHFSDGEEVTPALMAERHVIDEAEEPVKILGRGELSKKLTVHAHGFTRSAREKIEAAGGTAEELTLVITGVHATIKRLPKAQIEAIRAKQAE
ncbi:MAG: 50S ribosomal protein L15 [Chloroflexi bacterium]|nr:50S ribosomal protein L15 [Chloroflexota bacterium]